MLFKGHVLGTACRCKMQVKKQLDDGQQKSEVKVDMHLSVMKEISAKWLEGMWDKLQVDSRWMY